MYNKELMHLGHNCQLVVINSHSCLPVAAPVLYTPAYSKAAVQFSFLFLVCSLVCRAKRGGACHETGKFIYKFFSYVQIFKQVVKICCNSVLDERTTP